MSCTDGERIRACHGVSSSLRASDSLRVPLRIYIDVSGVKGRNSRPYCHIFRYRIVSVPRRVNGRLPEPEAGIASVLRGATTRVPRHTRRQCAIQEFSSLMAGPAAQPQRRYGPHRYIYVFTPARDGMAGVVGGSGRGQMRGGGEGWGVMLFVLEVLRLQRRVRTGKMCSMWYAVIKVGKNGS